jgi:hypothetical protein
MSSANSIAEQSGQMEFSSDPERNDRTTNPAHKLFAATAFSGRKHPRGVAMSALPLNQGALEKGVSMRILVIVALALCAFSSQMHARCTCQCVDGQTQPLCSSTLDIAPTCMGICGPVAPSIAPINPARIPPLGTTSCRHAQICDQFGNCRWQQVCRNFELGNDEPASP